MTRKRMTLADLVRIQRAVLAHDDEPCETLAALRAMRAAVDVLEVRTVDQCLADGMTWQGIAEQLGVTRQAVWAKHHARHTMSNPE